MYLSGETSIHQMCIRERYKGEIDLALESGLNALKSSYHKLWDMNEMYNEALATYPFLPTMPSTWMTAAKLEDSNPEHLLYQFGHTNTDPYQQYARKEMLDLYDKNDDCLLYTS